MNPPDYPFPMFPNTSFEETLWSQQITKVAGLDEAGRGAWAGPVCAGAVILPPSPNIARDLSGVRDSKQMTPLQRTHWANVIMEKAAAWGIGSASAEEIDALGIVSATRLAMQRALFAMKTPAHHLLLDYIRLPEVDLPQTPLIKGDARCLSIAAASVLAKTSRDTIMQTMDVQIPGYHLAVHKGYGTAAHLKALKSLGPSAFHRASFAPVKRCMATINPSDTCRE